MNMWDEYSSLYKAHFMAAETSYVFKKRERERQREKNRLHAYIVQCWLYWKHANIHGYMATALKVDDEQ